MALQENTSPSTTWGFVLRVGAKAAVLFALVNVVYALIQPMPFIGRISAYNWLVQGRERLPYGYDPASYNLSLNSVEAMVASTTLAKPKPADEYRVLLLGDSSVWGVLQRPHETLAGNLNAANAVMPDGRKLRAYNLGYPMMSLTKDVMLLDEAMQYQPDQIVWLLTLESFAPESQLEPPPVQQNYDRIAALHARYTLPIDLTDRRLVHPTLLEKTLVGERRALADWLRLQLYGAAWTNTGIDQIYGAYTPRSNDFEPDESWHTIRKVDEFVPKLAWTALDAGAARAEDVPVILINEPIFIADGMNSDLRYNFWYPIWAYDAYRVALRNYADERNWAYLDVWDVIAPEEFTDSPVHLTPAGSQILSERVLAAIIQH